MTIVRDDNGDDVLVVTRPIFFKVGKDGVLKKCKPVRTDSGYLREDTVFMIGKIFANEENVKVVENA